MNPRSRFTVIVALFAGIVIFGVFPRLDDADTLFGQKMSVMPPAFFPAVVAVLLLLFSIVELARRETPRRCRGRAPADHDSRAVFATVASILLFGFVIERLGYLAGGVLAATLVTLLVNSRHTLPVIVLSTAGAGGLYWLLTRVFNTYLPSGTILPDVFA
ncbi:MAG: tripartite tricarboxylate transporter TctB family protein [Proteobacteria bacterium]|nr:MAG: tripartite tricarboxylate transporter TctB family protein [Pseudomonadota bacterium]